MADDLPLSLIERRLLRAMATASAEAGIRKSVAVLRYAMLEANAWDEKVNYSLCNDSDEHPLVAYTIGPFNTVLR